MEPTNLTEILKELDKINSWFDQQQEIDVEKGLEKIKEGMQLVKASRIRLKEIENEFEEIKKELVEESQPLPPEPN
jgi:exonuclease VII small subunit